MRGVVHNNDVMSADKYLFLHIYQQHHLDVFLELQTTILKVMSSFENEIQGVTSVSMAHIRNQHRQ